MPADMASAAAHAFWLLVEPARLMVLVIGVVIVLAVAVRNWVFRAQYTEQNWRRADAQSLQRDPSLPRVSAAKK